MPERIKSGMAAGEIQGEDVWQNKGYIPAKVRALEERYWTGRSRRIVSCNRILAELSKNTVMSIVNRSKPSRASD
jgi:hypothetical protein